MPLTQAREICPASRLNNVRYAIRDLACVADEVTKQGHKVLPLNIGDPLSFDFETPAHIIEAVHKAMLDGKNGYAPSEGVHEALEAIRGEAARKGIKGNTLDYYLNILRETRESTLAEFRKRDDAWLMAVDKTWGWGPTNNYCKWFHVTEHEANHNGQIKLLKSRIPGAKPASE